MIEELLVLCLWFVLRRAGAHVPVSISHPSVLGQTQGDRIRTSCLAWPCHKSRAHDAFLCRGSDWPRVSSLLLGLPACGVGQQSRWRLLGLRPMTLHYLINCPQKEKSVTYWRQSQSLRPVAGGFLRGCSVDGDRGPCHVTSFTPWPLPTSIMGEADPPGKAPLRRCLVPAYLPGSLNKRVWQPPGVECLMTILLEKTSASFRRLGILRTRTRFTY